MNYKITIGLETHIQLKTATKVFCACPNEYGNEPNRHICPVCLGYPGALPVLNREAVRKIVTAGLLIGSRIGERCLFDRKSYFYPDVAKNYQVTQFATPFCVGGSIEIQSEGRTRHIRVNRIHLEEDVAKCTHGTATSQIDFNRCGTPLMEVVTEPDLESPEEALAYLQALRQIMVYGGVSDCNLEQGNMRCDLNLSLRPVGQSTLGTKTEIKNMNTLKGVVASLRAEIARQTALLDAGGTVRQETLRYDPEANITIPMRSKEYAHDYRYFPEPDLMPVVIEPDELARWQAELPELPAARRQRFVTAYGLPDYDASVLTAEKPVADYFEATVQHCQKPKAASNWIMTSVMQTLTERHLAIESFPIAPDALAELIDLADSKTINSNSAKEVFGAMLETNQRPRRIVDERGMAQLSDASAIEALVRQVIQDHPETVHDYNTGKKAALQFLVGQVMKHSRGKANPGMAAAQLAAACANASTTPPP